MAKTIFPAFWTPWLLESLIRKANILGMGFVDIDTAAPITKSGKVYHRPHTLNLENIAVANKYIATTTLTPTQGTDSQENIVVCHFGDAYYETEYDNIVRGDRAMDGYRKQLADVVNNLIQDWMCSMVKGVFATTLATSHTYDYTAIGDGLIGVDPIINACQTKLGEDMSSMTGMIMHSKIQADMIKDSLIEYYDAATFGSEILYKGAKAVPTYQGMRIFVNDTLCAPTGEIGAYIYPTYVLKGQPFYLAWQRTLRTEMDRDILTGGGKDILAWYVDFAPAIKYVSWVHTSYDPTAANLETGAYWEKVSGINDKNIPIIRILTKGMT